MLPAANSLTLFNGKVSFIPSYDWVRPHQAWTVVTSLYDFPVFWDQTSGLQSRETSDVNMLMKGKPFLISLLQVKVQSIGIYNYAEILSVSPTHRTPKINKPFSPLFYFLSFFSYRCFNSGNISILNPLSPSFYFFTPSTNAFSRTFSKALGKALNIEARTKYIWFILSWIHLQWDGNSRHYFQSRHSSHEWIIRKFNFVPFSTFFKASTYTPFTTSYLISSIHNNLTLLYISHPNPLLSLSIKFY